jgi:hypothetical protein
MSWSKALREMMRNSTGQGLAAAAKEVFQTRRMAFRGIDPVQMRIVPDWFAVLLERIDGRLRLRPTPHASFRGARCVQAAVTIENWRRLEL